MSMLAEVSLCAVLGFIIGFHENGLGRLVLFVGGMLFAGIVLPFLRSL